MRITNLHISTVTTARRVTTITDPDHADGLPIEVEYEIKLREPESHIRFTLELDDDERPFQVGTVYSDVGGMTFCATSPSEARPTQASFRWRNGNALPYHREMLVEVSQTFREA